jgi:hypothetical protein
MDAVNAGYPAALTVETPDQIDRWRPFVQWLLAIPQLLILRALDALSTAVALISWFAILFTGKLPEGLAGLQALYLRYSARTAAYVGFLVVGYPPFSFAMDAADPGDHPGVRFEVTPDLGDRNRLTTFFRLILLIPQFIVLAVLTVVVIIVGVIAAFAVLFTGRWPEGLRSFVVGVLRWGLRVEAYLVLLNDQYPPFSLT